MRIGLIAGLMFVASCAGLPQVPEARTADEVMRAFRDQSKIRVVNVWATWCVPCVAEIRDLQSIADRFHESNVEVIGISLDDAIPGDRRETRNQVQRFLVDRRIRFRNFYYTGKTNELADKLRFDGSIPITIVYDANGHELARSEGRLDVERFRRTLESLARTSH